MIATSDAVCVFLWMLYPSAQDTINWVDAAAHVYACSGGGLLLSPTEVRSMYMDTLIKHGGRRNAEVKLQYVADQITKWNNTKSSSIAATPNSLVNLSATTAVSKDVLLTLWAKCDALKGSDWFRDIVNPETMMVHDGSELGPWRKVIKQSMSVSSVKQMIQTGAITTISQLKNAFLHVAANSVMFNAPQGDYPHIARSYGKQCAELLDAAVRQEEKDDLGEPLSKRARR